MTIKSGRAVSLTDKQQLARWVADYGEDSDFVRVGVRGQFPRAGTMQFIDGERVVGAMTRILDPATDTRLPLVMGVDVARFGDDRSVIFLRPPKFPIGQSDWLAAALDHYARRRIHLRQMVIMGDAPREGQTYCRMLPDQDVGERTRHGASSCWLCG